MGDVIGEMRAPEIPHNVRYYKAVSIQKELLHVTAAALPSLEVLRTEAAGHTKGHFRNPKNCVSASRSFTGIYGFSHIIGLTLWWPKCGQGTNTNFASLENVLSRKKSAN